MSNKFNRIGVTILVVMLAFITGLNIFTIVSPGTVKVQTTFGTVNDIVLTEGMHFVNPVSSFGITDITNQKYEIADLAIPTQDRFKSAGNVTVLFRIDGTQAASIRKNYGTAEQFIEKTLRQQLRSIIRDEGRKIKDSRGLALSENVSNMQENTTTRLNNALSNTGIVVQEVLIQDINFDPRIKNQILATQLRIQKEEAQKSLERITITNAKIATEKAKGNASVLRTSTDAEAYKIQKLAEANKIKVISVAEATAQGIIILANANIKLSKSLTPNILRKQELDNEAVLYEKSKGNVPTTIIGDTDLRAIGVPVAVK